MDLRFSCKTIFTPNDLLKITAVEKKKFLYRAGSYLLAAARRNIGVRPQLKKVKFINSFGVEQEENIWAHKAVEGHSPYDHPTAGRPMWKQSFRYGVDEAAEVVDIGAIKGKNQIAPLHEFGGNRKVEWTEFTWGGKGQRIRHEMSRNHSYGRRETMRPALERSRKYISSFWKGVISNM